MCHEVFRERVLMLVVDLHCVSLARMYNIVFRSLLATKDIVVIRMFIIDRNGSQQSFR